MVFETDFIPHCSLLVLVVVYFVGGILVNKYVRKIEEGSLVPNSEFWKALPSYIKVRNSSYAVNIILTLVLYVWN